MSQELLMECAYDWGKVFRLYRDHVQVHDTTYALSDLLSVEPTYHRFMGVSSARLVLRFNEQVITLRGIAEVDMVRQAVVYLDACALHHDSAIEPITEYVPSLPHAYTRQKQRKEDLSQVPTRPIETPQKQQKRASQPNETHRQPARSLREHQADIKLLVQRFKERPLPTVPVPLRLQRDEYALYAVPATIRQKVQQGEPYSHSTFEPKDQGMLIFTSRRLIYMGRTGQLITDYARLLRVSYQQEGITIHTEHWHEGTIFEVRRPLECSVYLEAIIECFREEWSAVPANNAEHYPVAATQQPYVADAYTNTSATTVVTPAAAASSPVAVTNWSVAEEL